MNMDATYLTWRHRVQGTVNGFTGEKHVSEEPQSDSARIIKIFNLMFM